MGNSAYQDRRQKTLEYFQGRISFVIDRNLRDQGLVELIYAFQYSSH